MVQKEVREALSFRETELRSKAIRASGIETIVRTFASAWRVIARAATSWRSSETREKDV